MSIPDPTTIDPTIKTWIDQASYEQLLERWRFAKSGDPAFSGATGTYYSMEMDRRRRADPSIHTKASKAIGWD